MLRFFYNPKYKYTNRRIINVSGDDTYTDKDYANIDSPDTINGHIIYKLAAAEQLPTYILDLESNKRWFVSGITQLRTGKYQISLLRDIISESPEIWSNEEAYINAGLATDYNKYKRWDLPFTNTKVSQQRLNINGKSSYFVFYVNKQNITDDTISEEDLKIKSSSIPNITGVDYRVSNLNEILGFEYVGAGEFNYWRQTKAIMQTLMPERDLDGHYIADVFYNLIFDSLNSSDNNMTIQSVRRSTNRIFLNTTARYFKSNANNVRLNVRNAIETFTKSYQDNYGQTIPEAIFNSLNGYVNKYILNTTTNKVYTIRKTTGNSYSEDIMLPKNQTTGLLSLLRGISYPGGSSDPADMPPGVNNAFDVWGDSYYRFLSTRELCQFTLEEIGSATTFEFNFIANTRKLPRSAVRCVNIVPSEDISQNDLTQMLMLAQTNGINEDNTTGRILDIQYLPFSIATETNENIKINNTPLIAKFIDDDDVYFNVTLPQQTNINKETDTIKIISPSRASQYLFRPYDNDGRMEFDFKCTLRPYTSTMYVRPSSKGLLIYDWDDKDCLIINEDFSLTNVTSQWTEYIYSNRNYQNAFERTMQGREFERTWERRIEQAQAKSDEWTARNISAQKAQTYTGNIPIISSIAGAIGTAFQDNGYMQAAQLDREYNEAMYQESVSLAREQFAYQLDNVKSQPLIPSKVTAFDVKSLDGIYLEFYSTNETEKQAINDYYRYNGNRVDAYGTFNNYWGWFVRGKIIISQHYTQPEIDELNRRLSTGIFTEVNNGN